MSSFFISGGGYAAGGGGGGGLTSINADATAAQLLTVGTAGSNFAIVDAGGGSHVFNLPDATAAHRGALTSADWTTFNGKLGAAVTSLNADSTAAQLLTVGTAGTDFAIVNAGGGSHVLNLPTASAANRGALSSADWTTFNGKGSGTITGSGSAGQATFFTGASAIAGDNQFFWDNGNKRLGLGTTGPSFRLHVLDSTITALFTSAAANPNTVIITGDYTSSYSSFSSGINIADITNTGTSHAPITFGISGVTETAAIDGISTPASYGVLAFKTRLNGGAAIAEGMRLDGDGRVGIGTATAQNSLDVHTNLNGNGGVAIGSYGGVNAAPNNGLIVSGPTGIGTATPNAVSVLDLTSTTLGFLPPRMTTTQRNAITAVEGLVVYDLTVHGLFNYDGTNWVQQ